MSTHVRRILEVAVAVTAAAWTAALASPATTHFLEQHPQDAAYVALGAGVVRAAYKAIVDRRAASAVEPPASSGSSTMGAK